MDEKHDTISVRSLWLACPVDRDQHMMVSPMRPNYVRHALSEAKIIAGQSITGACHISVTGDSETWYTTRALVPRLYKLTLKARENGGPHRTVDVDFSDFALKLDVRYTDLTWSVSSIEAAFVGAGTQVSVWLDYNLGSFAQELCLRHVPQAANPVALFDARKLRGILGGNSFNNPWYLALRADETSYSTFNFNGGNRKLIGGAPGHIFRVDKRYLSLASDFPWGYQETRSQRTNAVERLPFNAFHSRIFHHALEWATFSLINAITRNIGPRDALFSPSDSVPQLIRMLKKHSMEAGSLKPLTPIQILEFHFIRLAKAGDYDGNRPVGELVQVILDRWYSLSEVVHGGDIDDDFLEALRQLSFSGGEGHLLADLFSSAILARLHFLHGNWRLLGVTLDELVRLHGLLPADLEKTVDLAELLKWRRLNGRFGLVEDELQRLWRIRHDEWIMRGDRNREMVAVENAPIDQPLGTAFEDFMGVNASGRFLKFNNDMVVALKELAVAFTHPFGKGFHFSRQRKAHEAFRGDVAAAALYRKITGVAFDDVWNVGQIRTQLNLGGVARIYRTGAAREAPIGGRADTGGRADDFDIFADDPELRQLSGGHLGESESDSEREDSGGHADEDSASDAEESRDYSGGHVEEDREETGGHAEEDRKETGGHADDREETGGCSESHHREPSGGDRDATGDHIEEASADVGDDPEESASRQVSGDGTDPASPGGEPREDSGGCADEEEYDEDMFAPV